MGLIVGQPGNTSTNTPTPLSNYLGEFSEVAQILALPQKAGNYADLKVLNGEDIQYYYDAGDNEWKSRGADFKGYFRFLKYLKIAFPNPVPTWLATNLDDRKINYVVFNGEWIEEPTALDAAYLDFRLRYYLTAQTYKQLIIDNSTNSQLIIDDVTADFTLTDSDFRKTFIHTGTGTINITIPSIGLRNAFVAMFKVEGTGNILLVQDNGVNIDTEKLLTDGSGIVERRGNTQEYYTNGSFE